MKDDQQYISSTQVDTTGPAFNKAGLVVMWQKSVDTAGIFEVLAYVEVPYFRLVQSFPDLQTALPYQNQTANNHHRRLTPASFCKINNHIVLVFLQSIWMYWEMLFPFRRKTHQHGHHIQNRRLQRRKAGSMGCFGIVFGLWF